MSKPKYLAPKYLAIAATAAAFAAAGTAQTAPAAPAAERTPAGQSSAPAPDGAAFTDAQLRAYLGAQRELAALNASGAVTSGAPAPETQAQIQAILQRYSIDGATLNQIAQSSRTDQKLAARLASLKSDPVVKTQ